MRTIKFRAYCAIESGNEMIYFTESKFDNGLWFEYTKNHIDEYLSPLMQFTGLTDKNGVEIFEGDVYHQGDKNILYQVVFDGCGFIGNQIGNKSLAGLAYFKDKIEVIGNIYETKQQ